GDFENSGVVAADGADGFDAGTVSVRAGGDALLRSGSTLSARGRGADSSGGEVTVLAGPSATFEPGAVIDVRGGDQSGDGGFIEFSAEGSVSLDGGSFLASAASGSAGRVLIDPTDINVTADNFTDGADLILEADDSITVAG